jgi:hypothetical protein
MKDKIRIRKYEAVHIEAYDPVHAKWAKNHENFPGEGISLFYNDNFVGAGGIHPVSQKVGMVWLFRTPYFSKYRMTAIKIIKKVIDEWINRGTYHRIQATVLMGDDVAERFIQFLGFHCETPEGMINFTDDGATHKLYARII